MIPAIGRIVHYCLAPGMENAGHERPAIITVVGVLLGGLCELTVFPSRDDKVGVSYFVAGDEGTGAGQWHAYEDCPKMAPQSPPDALDTVDAELTAEEESQ